MALIRRDGNRDVFVHYTAVVGDGYHTLQEVDAVDFEIAQGSKGPRASQVVAISNRSFFVAYK